MRWLWAFLAIYAAARFTQAFPDKIPMAVIVALHVLPPLAFAIVHGAVVYRRRGILIFVLLCVMIGGGFEELSLNTGFPFGHYYFTDAMGPKIFQIPILLGLAYVGIGYLAWTLAGIILPKPRVVARPLLAAAIMTAWDLSMDPIWANLVHAWLWEQGGAYFGVPVSNFFGWYLTNYAIYQAFALVVRRPAQGSAAFWRVAVLFYAVLAAGNLIVIAPSHVATFTDAAGVTWRVSSMMLASALVSIFVMGGFALAAWLRLRAMRATPRRRPCA
jgi:uncharacterized membrane protein